MRTIQQTWCTRELESIKIIDSIDVCFNEIDVSNLAEHYCSMHVYVHPCKCACMFMYMCMFIDECMLICTCRLNQVNLPFHDDLIQFYCSSFK